MDLQLPGMSGIEAITRIQAEFSGARIIVLTTYTGDVQVLRALKAGTRLHLKRPRASGTPRAEEILKEIDRKWRLKPLLQVREECVYLHFDRPEAVPDVRTRFYGIGDSGRDRCPSSFVFVLSPPM
jgi:response regulator RpfG family c-di-GMP phosphodiesterase